MSDVPPNQRPSPPDPLSPELLACQFRQHTGTLSRQATVTLAGTLFLVAGGYLFKIYVSRELGAEGLGVYALGMTTIGFFSLFATLGVPQAAARFVAIYRGAGEGGRVRRFFRRGLSVVTATSGLLAVLMVASGGWIAGSFYNVRELEGYFPFFATILILSAVQMFLAQYLRGLQEVARRVFITHFVGFPAKVLTTLALFAAGWGLAGYIAAEIAHLALIILLLAILLRRLAPETAAGRPVPGGPEASADLGREPSVYAASMMGLNLLSFVTGRLDVVLLGIFLTAGEVGIYSIAATTAAFVPTLLTSLNSIFGPIIADLYARDQIALLRRLFQISTKWCLGLTWPLVIVIVFFGREMMGVFGPEFEAGAPTLALLALGQLVNVGVGSVGNLLVMSGHQRLEVRIAVATAALSLALNITLIPRLGILGAALALTATLTISNLLRSFMVWARLKLLPYNRHALRLLPPAAASALVAGGAWWWTRPGESLPAMALALFGAYAAFVVTAVAFSLDGDDRIILGAVRGKLNDWIR